jgi:hypothetical protein
LSISASPDLTLKVPVSIWPSRIAPCRSGAGVPDVLYYQDSRRSR